MGEKKKVFETPWFSIESEGYSDPVLEGQVFYRVNCPDGITILPITPEGKIVIVKQFRFALNKYTLELPAGNVDFNESPVFTARRELYEEAGYVCSDLIYVGEGRSATNRINNKIHIFYGKCAKRDINFVPKEKMKVLEVTISELRNIVTAGQFESLPALGIVLFTWWKLGIPELKEA